MSDETEDVFSVEKVNWWRCGADYIRNGYKISARPSCFAVVIPIGGNTEPLAKKYAHLFAAAPDLLAACEALLKCDGLDALACCAKITRAAVAKAKGEQQ